MQFTEKAEQYRLLIQQPCPMMFRPNRRGIMQAVLRAEIVLRNKRGIKPVGQQAIFYTEQDPDNPAQVESQLVRSGIWKSRDVGWLWTYLSGNKICYLAKVTPEKKVNLNKGWITEKGVFVIDLETPERKEDVS